MNKHDEIYEWISNGKPYETGCMMYCAYGDNEYLKEYFAEGKDAIRRGALADKLGEIAAMEKKRLVNMACEMTTKVEPIVVACAESIVYTELPSELIGFNKKIQSRYNDILEMKVLMRGMPDGEQLREACERVLYLREIISELYGLKDYFAEHGKLPEGYTIARKQYVRGAQATPVDMAKRNNLRTVVSRYRRKVKECIDADKKMELNKKLYKAERDLTALERKVDGSI